MKKNVNNHFVKYLEEMKNNNSDNTILQNVSLDNIFKGKINLKYEWPLDDIFNENSEIQNKIGGTHNEINNVKNKIIEKIRQLGNSHLITSSSIVQWVQEYSLGTIGGQPFKLFIKQQGDQYIIHKKIGYIE